MTANPFNPAVSRSSADAFSAVDLSPPPMRTNVAPLLWTPAVHASLRTGSRASDRTSARALVYSVDDDEDLTVLYDQLLAGAGYAVRSFNNRAEALTELKKAEPKPNLLITDYLGVRMPVEQFMEACRLVHPAVRILMATGLHPMDGLSCAKPDRLIRKPFTAEEFLGAVRTVLAG